jgi:hypothetical protein
MFPFSFCGGGQVPFGLEAGVVACRVRNPLQFSGLINKPEHSLHVAQYVTSLDLEAPIGGFVSERVGTVIIQTVDLLQNGDLLLRLSFLFFWRLFLIISRCHNGRAPKSHHKPPRCCCKCHLVNKYICFIKPLHATIEMYR